MPDESDALTNYLFTIRTEYLDIPCINKSYVCTYSQFKKEFSMFYPEIDYDIPKEVLEKFGDATKVADQCLVIPLGPITKIDKAAWICHENKNDLFRIQKNLSNDIFNNYQKNYEFNVNYIQNQKEVHKGKLYLSADDWTFKKDDEVVVASSWIETQPFASTVYMKETIKWLGEGPKPEDDRCFKVFRKKEVINNNPDFFCVYLNQDDLADEISDSKAANGNQINPEDLKAKELAKSKFAAQIYTNKINVRLQEAAVKDSINKMAALPTSTINIDSDTINPVKTKVRDEYLKSRHELLNENKVKSMTPTSIAKRLDELKQKNIKEVCKGIELCVDAMNYSVDKGLLPLSGEREKFSMDKENPYNNIAPKIAVKINIPDKDSPGRKAIDEVAKIKGAKEYFAEETPEEKGPIPTYEDIKRAYNTLQNLKENKKYIKMEEIKKGCKANERNNIANVRRKISFMMYSGDNDIFFDYFGYLREYQFKK